MKTLDFLYGHVSSKLYNAEHYIDKHLDLGVVIGGPARSNGGPRRGG